jgi:cytochrome c biogenesis protein CcdA
MAWVPERRFWMLRRLGKVLSAVAWIALVVTLLITPVGIARAVLGGFGEDVWEWVRYGVSGGLFFLLMMFLAQSIEVVLAIEENTKEAGYVLERLTTLMQQVRDRIDGAAAGSPGMGGAGGPEPSREPEHPAEGSAAKH